MASRTACVSQFSPDNYYTIFVGKESQFVCFRTHARGHVRGQIYLRRNGRMPGEQKIARIRLEKHFMAPPCVAERSFRELAGLMG